MATLYITGVWKTGDKITHVMLHTINADNTLNKGVKTLEQTVVNQINRAGGDVVYTLTWNYTDASWAIGAQVLVVKEGYGEILRTHRDKTVRNNLDNVLRMENFV